jgi:LEA14-like dessication related protein
MNFVRYMVLLVAIAVFSSCSTIAEQLVKEPKVELQSVKLRDLKPDGGTVLIGVEVDNPNPFGLKLDDLTYELEIGGKALSKGQLKEAAQVAANAKSVIEIPVPLKFEELFSSAMDFVTKKSSAYRVKGSARFGLITLPFDKTGEMKLR